ncbi:toprim domain-containing protein [Candidatus Bathyarchaeota archaeon]|nr:toprim domain-containing protein [Candidatus Bathyarchaeota archaeon]
MSSLERKLERINCLIQKLKDEVSMGALLVVEGEKDIESLKALGVESDMLAIKSCGKNLQDMVDKITSMGDKEVILLMDFDRHGKELTERLSKVLEELKVKLNLNFWRQLSQLLNSDVKDIEGLAAYVETLKRKIEGRSQQSLVW